MGELGSRILLLMLIGGAVLGSLLTTVIERLPRGESPLRGRSRCPHCRVALAARDLIPVVSFLILRGRCRHCRKPIPQWHLWTELSAIALTVFTVALRGGEPVLDTAFLGGILALLLALAVIDLQEFLLPDPLVLTLALAGVTRHVVFGGVGLPSALAGGLVGAGLLWGITWLWSPLTRLRPASAKASAGRQGFGGSPAHRPMSVGGPARIATRSVAGGPAMGFGDVKLAGAMGLTLGLGGLLVALFLAFVVGGLAGGILILTRRATLRSRIPFGPFLAGATAVVLWFPELPSAFSLLLGLS